MPLPYTEEAIAHVAARVQQVQEFMGRRILLENVSSYVGYTHSEMTEWEFISEVARCADCLLLLDINNVCVSARNHGFDPLDFLNGMSAARVWQLHLAGHSDYGDVVIDTRDHPVASTVWDLYAQALRRFGPVSAMIERDDRYPPFAELLDEFAQMRAIGQRVLDEREPQRCSA